MLSDEYCSLYSPTEEASREEIWTLILSSFSSLMQLLPLQAQLLVISTTANHGCEAGSLHQRYGKKSRGHQKGRMQKTMSRRNSFKTTPF